MAASGYTPISLYYSTTPTQAPSGTNLVAGELALNTADGKLYFKNSSNVVTLLASSSGSTGDVVGPASSTDTAVAIFDGTTGKLLKNSAVTIGTTGNTVISGTDNTNAMLRITQLGTGNALVVEDSANPDSTPFVINASGQVIAGYDSTPVSGASFTVQGTAAGYAAIRYSDTASLTGYLNHYRSRGSTVGTPSAVQSADMMGRYTLFGYNGTSASYIASAEVRGEVDGAPGASDMPGRLVFATTASGASSVTERMRINNAGEVSIGTGTTTGVTLRVNKNITGATSAFGVYSPPAIQADVTSSVQMFGTFPSIVDSAFTLSSLNHFFASQGTKGASATLTNQYGFVANSTLTGATNNYGFYSDIASGTGRWNFYANGTAENYLGGNLKIGATTARGTTAGTNHLSIFNGTAPEGTLTNGVTLYSASGDFNFMDSGGNGFKVGFRNIPPVGTKTGSYTLAVADVGKYVQVSTGGSITIPDATFAEGDVISIFNNTSAGITITCTITTAYIAGTDSDKATMTLASRGVATILFISSTVCVVSGNVS